MIYWDINGINGGIQFYWDRVYDEELKNDKFIRAQIFAYMMGWA